MNKFLKELFCRHIWKEIDEEFLRTERIGESYGYLTLYHTYAFCAKKFTCVKCNKSETHQYSKLLI